MTAKLTERLTTHVTPEFYDKLLEESATTHTPLPTLIRQLLHEALEARLLHRVVLPSREYWISLTPDQKRKLERLAYTIVEADDNGEPYTR